jgi:hypothetical protein
MVLRLLPPRFPPPPLPYCHAPSIQPAALLDVHLPSHLIVSWPAGLLSLLLLLGLSALGVYMDWMSPTVSSSAWLLSTTPTLCCEHWTVLFPLCLFSLARQGLNASRFWITSIVYCLWLLCSLWNQRGMMTCFTYCLPMLAGRSWQRTGAAVGDFHL